MQTVLEHYTLYLGEPSSALRGRVDVGRLRGGGWRQALSGFVRGGDDVNRLAPRLLDRRWNLRCHMIGGRDRGLGSRPVSSTGQALRGNDGVGGVRFILLAVTVVQRNGQEPADRGCVGICQADTQCWRTIAHAGVLA